MADVVEIGTIRENLRQVMAEKGKKPTTLSLAVGTNRTLVKDLLERNDNITVSTLCKLAGALDVPLHRLLEAPPVPIVGYIGAGGTVIFNEIDDYHERVSRPPAIAGNLEALVVRGDSMLPRYKDGDYPGCDHG